MQHHLHLPAYKAPAMIYLYDFFMNMYTFACVCVYVRVYIAYIDIKQPVIAHPLQAGLAQEQRSSLRIAAGPRSHQAAQHTSL